MSPEETRLRDEFVQIIRPWFEVAMNSAIPEPWEVSAHCAARAADAILTRLRGETDLSALLSEVDRLRTLAEPPWRDADDSYSEAIHAAHPMRTKRHDVYATAMAMVGNRRSKYALVDLVNWLLIEADQHRARAERLAGALRPLVRCMSAFDAERWDDETKVMVQFPTTRRARPTSFFYVADVKRARQALAQEGEG